MTTHERFFATATGGRRHLPQCTHLLGKEVIEVSANDPRELCDMCEKELSGYGRTYHDDLEAAFAFYKQPVETRPLVKQLIADVVWNEIWTPYSNSYITLARDGRGVAWIQKTLVHPSAEQVVELPGYGLTAPGTRGEDRSHIWGDTCPVTFIKHPKNGHCDDCGQHSA